MNPMKNASETSHPSGISIHRIFGWHPRFPAASAAGIFIASLLFLSLETSAQETYFRSFLKIDGIQGESMIDGHRDEIDLIGFTSGVEVPPPVNPSGARPQTGKPVFQPISVFKYVDQTSPLLLVNCAIGKSFRNATLTVAKVSSSGAVDFLKIVLSDVTITKVAASVGDSDITATPGELVALNFNRIEWTVTTIGANGRPKITTGGWDLRTNTSL